MFLVEKGFANNEISATKGKVIEIKDKKLASALIDAGYITPYSEKDMSNKEAKETIKKLEKEIISKDEEIATLNDMIAELEEKLSAKSGEEVTPVTEPPTDGEDDNLDNNEPPTDGEKNNENDGNTPSKENEE